MNMLEALREAKDDNLWARPVAWRNWPGALAYHRTHGYFELVPNRGRFEPALLPGPDDLFGEWEAVEPDVVLKGG